MNAKAQLKHPLMPAIESLCRGEHGDPFALLGPHADGAGTVVRAFLPEAEQAWVVPSGARAAPVAMTRLHPAGFFEALLRRKPPVDYRLRAEARGQASEIDDPYRFPSRIGEMDAHLIAEGTHQRLYDVLGSHPCTHEGVDGVAFAVWAPNARRVSVVGDFNRWDGRCHPMRKRVEIGVWELFIPGVAAGALYKYEILGPYGELLPLKADPYAFECQDRPATASVVYHGGRRDWHDGAWMARRGAAFAREAPVSIYEVHLGSWMRVPEEGHRYLTYREQIHRLVPYVAEMGFTHVELLPVTEHPFDGSWGYQPIGLYAPTRRFGGPDDFAALVEAFHEAGIGVLMDWVPGHFPTDAHGLGRFDGTALYEHADPRQGFHRDWNTLIFNYGRREVTNYLLANALYWLRDYHIDGLRVDAVASMLYLDYSREHGDWIPNQFGGNENIEAIDFLKRMNELAYGDAEGAVTVAEESTAWPGVSKPTWANGLGFGYKWNMGWMHDTLRYMGKEPLYRRWHHNDLTFGLLYAFSENFVLPLSHDEVVHGKGSLLGRMPGDRWQKFANLRAYFGFMFAHPGKKLLFMGGEFGQEREWNHDASLDWHLLDVPEHRGLQRLVRDLNLTYRAHPALHALDCEGEGFEWIDDRDAEHSTLTFLRKGPGDAPPVVAACNFTPEPRRSWCIGVPRPGRYVELVNTDDVVYGGSGMRNAEPVVAEPVPWHGRSHSIRLTLPPLATVWLTPMQD